MQWGNEAHCSSSSSNSSPPSTSQSILRGCPAAPDAAELIRPQTNWEAAGSELCPQLSPRPRRHIGRGNSGYRSATPPLRCTCSRDERRWWRMRDAAPLVCTAAGILVVKGREEAGSGRREHNVLSKQHTHHFLPPCHLASTTSPLAKLAVCGVGP